MGSTRSMNNYFCLEGGSSSTSNQQAIHNFRAGNGVDRVRDDPRLFVERRVFGRNRKIITAISVESSPPAGLGSRLRFRRSPRWSHGNPRLRPSFSAIPGSPLARPAAKLHGKNVSGNLESPRGSRRSHVDDSPLRNLSLLASQWDPLPWDAAHHYGSLNLIYLLHIVPDDYDQRIFYENIPIIAFNDALIVESPLLSRDCH